MRLMTRLVLSGGEVAVRNGLARANIVCRGPTIEGITADIPSDATVVDCQGLLLGPGFVDIHTHGGGGVNFFAGDPHGVARYAAWAPQFGVTSFLASLLGRDDGETAVMLERLAYLPGATAGAELLGFHLEGPALNPARKGAFPGRMLHVPPPATFERWQTAANSAVRQVTIAPELDGASAFLAAVTGGGAVAAMGHTDATFDQARAAFGAGVTHVTHLFNAMRPIHQRQGGPAVAAMLDDRVTCELIADGAHVSPEMLRVAYGLLGRRRMVVVTDNMELAGTTAGTTEFAGSPATVDGQAAKREDGTIVGSIATMDQHFRNVRAWLGIDDDAAFQLCAENPATALGVGDHKGRLVEGYDADIVGLDRDGRVHLTICRGGVAYRSAAE